MTSTNNASNKPAAPVTVGDYNKVLLAAYRSAQNAITSAALTLRLIGHEEGSNDSLSVAVADLERIRAVVGGRADSIASAVQSRTATTADATNHKPAAAPTSDKPVAVESKPAAEYCPAPFSLSNVSTSALEKMSVTRYTETALDAWCTSRGTTTPPMPVFVASVKDELARRKPLRGGVETSPPAPAVLASTASKSAKEERQERAANPPVAAAPSKPAAPAPVKAVWRLQGSESVLLLNGHACRVQALPGEKFRVMVGGTEVRVVSWASHPKSMEATRNELYSLACTIAADHARALKAGKATEADINPVVKPAAPVAVQPSKPAPVASCIVDDEEPTIDAISDEERAEMDSAADENEGIAMHLCGECGQPTPVAAKFCPECGARQEDEQEEEVAPPVKPTRKPAVMGFGAGISETREQQKARLAADKPVQTPSKPAVVAVLDSATSMAALRQQAKDLKIKGYALPTIKRETLEAKIAEAQAAQAKAGKRSPGSRRGSPLPAGTVRVERNATTGKPEVVTTPKASKSQDKPASAGLSANQVTVLKYLASQKRSLTRAIIADETGISIATLSNLLKAEGESRMEASLVYSGHVESDTVDRNGRDVTVYSITDAGRAALKASK